MPKSINIPVEGQVFGMLTFISESGKNERSDKMGRYRCECGKESDSPISRVNNGYIKSCGCYKKAFIGKKTTTHGLSKEPLYYIWSSIIDRCENVNNERYNDYGGIGVVMCTEWRRDFKNFYDWCISNGWKKGLQIDKDIIPENLGVLAKIYSPEMCSIVTQKENVNHARSNKRMTYKGITKSVSQICEIFNVNSKRVHKRLRRGWSIEEAIETPKQESATHYRKYKNNS